MSGGNIAGGASVSDSVRFVHDVLEVIGVSVCVCFFFEHEIAALLWDLNVSSLRAIDNQLG